MKRLAGLAGVLALSLACVAPAHPQSASAPYLWRNVTVGAGGYVPDIVFSTAEKGLAYLRSDMGGAYRWDSAAGRWIALEDGLAESSYQGVESLAADPVDANVVYLAAGMYHRAPAAILRSHDRGRTWSVFPVPFHMGGNQAGRGMGERLAIDPNDTGRLYFGSRDDGLQVSRDHGETWRKAPGFPLSGLGPPSARGPHGGIGFVVFDPGSGSPGKGSRIIFAGSADPGPHHLFVSRDAGATWTAVPGGPPPTLLPVKAAINARGVMFIAYCNGIGPNDVTDGAVWRLDTGSGAWTDITPDRSSDRPSGGYMGLSLDTHHPGTVAVATLDRWTPGDTVWRSADDGRSWRSIDDSRRDISASPWLAWGEHEAKLGWWMSGLAIDPFDPDHVAYATGATIYETHDFDDAGRRQTHWRTWVEGVEQTAVLDLVSPAQGAHLISGFGDLGGFVHTRLDAAPSSMFLDPLFADTDALGLAGQASQVVVRSGAARQRRFFPGRPPEPSLALSRDGGATWSALRPPLPTPNPHGPGMAIAVSADGRAILAANGPAVRTDDDGRSWTPVRGLPQGGRPVADPVDPSRFYALDFATSRLFVSRDGGSGFSVQPGHGLPETAGDAPQAWEVRASLLLASPARAGELWFASRHGLFHSRDGGASFVRVDSDVQVEMLAFGKAAPGRDSPALYAVGRRGDLRAVWRSDDEGRSWLRLNDEAHEWGRRFSCIAGDPRVFGRVYVGTDGRGILYGDPAP